MRERCRGDQKSRSSRRIASRSASRSGAGARVGGSAKADSFIGLPASFKRPGDRVVDLDQHVARRGLRVRERLRDIVDRAARHARRLQHRDPVLGVRAAQHTLDLGLQRLLVLVAQRVGLEQRVLGEVGAVERLGQLDEEPVIAGGDDEVAVGGVRTPRTG